MRLRHLTTTSGHTRSSPRSEVADETLDLLRPIVRQRGGEVSGLVIEITRADPGAWDYTLRWRGGITAVRCDLRWRGEDATLAVTLLPGIAACDPDQIHMLGDAERCVAWAILEDHHAPA